MIDALFVDMDQWPVFFQVTWQYMKTGTVIIPVIALLWLVGVVPISNQSLFYLIFFNFSIIIHYYVSLTNILKSVNSSLIYQLRTVSQS